jgi:hypothetical protein
MIENPLLGLSIKAASSHGNHIRCYAAQLQFILKVGIAMYAKALQQLQHTMWLKPCKPSYTALPYPKICQIESLSSTTSEIRTSIQTYISMRCQYERFVQTNLKPHFTNEAVLDADLKRKGKESKLGCHRNLGKL